MKTRTQKCLAFISAFAFALTACSDEPSGVQASENSETDKPLQEESTKKMCLSEEYTGHYAEDGVTILCFAPDGDLTFWIDPDGIIGMPESSSGTASSSATDKVK